MKNRRTAVGLLVILFSTSLYSQGPSRAKVDSLKLLIPQLTDSLYIRNLLDISQHHLMYVETDSARKYVESALAALEGTEYSVMHTGAWSMRGALESFEGNHAESLFWLKKALEACVESQNLKGESAACTNLGRTYFELQDYPNSLKMHMRALEIDQEVGDIRGIFLGNHNLSTVFSRIEEPRTSISYELRALNTPNYEPDSIDLIPIYMGLAGDYRDIAHYDSSAYYSLKGIELARGIGHREFLIRLYEGIIHTYNEQEAFPKAFRYLKQLEPLVDTANYMHRGLYHNYLASAYFGVAAYDKALEQAMISLDYAKKTKTLFSYNNAYFQLYTFHKKLGPPEQALFYYEKYLDAQDSIYQQEKLEAVKQLEVRYQVQAKEDSIRNMREEALWKEQRIAQKNRWIIGLGVGLLILLGLVILFYRNKILKERLKKGLTEQRLLRTQMNPHFFFHALGTIQQYILQEKDPKDSLSYLAKFTRLMRNTLESSQTEFIPLTTEIESLENYLQLQQLRYNFSFDYHIAIDQTLSPKQYVIPPMLLQPVVENAIEHGLVRKKDSGKLTLTFHQNPQQLIVTVEDNGVGRDFPTKNPKSDHHTSLATQLIQERLVLLEKQLNQVAYMDIVDMKDSLGNPLGTRVIFHLPLHKKN